MNNQETTELGEVETEAETLEDLTFALQGIGLPPWLSQAEAVEQRLQNFPLQRPQIHQLRGRCDHLNTRLQATLPSGLKYCSTKSWLTQHTIVLWS